MIHVCMYVSQLLQFGYCGTVLLDIGTVALATTMHSQVHCFLEHQFAELFLSTDQNKMS